jgi:vitellogenic carboxypeptidase-like protein
MLRISFAILASAFVEGSFFAHAPRTTIEPETVLKTEEINFSRLLESHGPQFSRNASRVYGIGEIESYAGFFQTNSTVDNNMFIWYFPAQSGNSKAPLVIWLQGGPGGSSMFGLFAEMGPFQLDSNLKLSDRALSWNKQYAMLFIDNPVGAGFSYTNKNGYCTNTKTEVAQNLYSLLKQFYIVFPEQIPNDLYITVSYKLL